MVATLSGPYGQTMVEANSHPYGIGRAQDNQLVMSDARVSSHHAQLRALGQGYEIVDLGSSNGTFVNEQRLLPNTPYRLSSGDQIRLGETTYTFDAGEQVSQPPLEPTIIAGSTNGSASYAATVAAAPSYYVDVNGAQPLAYVPPPPVAAPPPPYTVHQAGYTPAPPAGQKRGRRSLWIVLGAVIALLLIAGGIAFAVVLSANRSTPAKTLTAFCDALEKGDYQTAYNQLSSGLQAKIGSEATFAGAYTNNGGLGKVTSCEVSNVNDGAGTGSINYRFSGGSSLVVDYTLIDESGASKINAQNPRSTPTLTLNTYCSALAAQDDQTAYDQLSAKLKQQLGSESQFAAAISAEKIKGCTASNINDTVGTGSVTYVRADGNKTSANMVLVKENGTWKIDTAQVVSTPTKTLLTYCGALKQQDYQTAYDQLSSTAQSQETETQFAANFKSVTITDCTPSNVNDTAGTGSLTYTFSGGQTAVFDYTLVKEQGLWKIDTEQKHS